MKNEMTFRRFFDELSSLAPSAQELSHLGMNDDSIEEIRSRFFVKKMLKNANSTGVLLLDELFENFDVTGVDGSRVTFANSPEIIKGKILFAREEAAPVVWNKELKRVEVLEFMNEDKVLFQAAKSISGFLSALLEVCKYYKRRSNKELEHVLESCCFLAGGKDYEGFYRYLLPQM